MGLGCAHRHAIPSTHLFPVTNPRVPFGWSTVKFLSVLFLLSFVGWVANEHN